MKALSILQPWAGLIACGAKRVETRSWPPPEELIGQRIAIHASKRLVVDAGWEALEAAGFQPTWAHAMPRGCIVGTAILGAFGRISDDGITPFRLRARDSRTERLLGDWSPGRWLWALDDAQALLRPIPCRGALRLWTVPPELLDGPPAEATGELPFDAESGP